MAIQREIIESEIRTTGGKQTQDDIIKVNQAMRDLAAEEKNLIFIKNKLESQGKKNTLEWKKNEDALKANRTATIKQKEELTKLNSQLKITEMTYNQLSKRAQELRGKLNNISKEADPKKWNAYNQQLKETQNQMSRVKSGTQQTSGVMGKLKGALGAFGLAVGGAALATKFFKAAIESSQSTADAFERAMTQAKTATGLFFKTLVSGDWSNFVKNLKSAIKFAGEYADIIDDLTDKKRSLTVQEAKANVELQKLHLISKNVTKSDEERLAAIDQIEKIERDLAEKRTQYAQKDYEATIKLVAQKTKLSDQQIKKIVEEYDSLETLLSTGKKYNDLQKELNKSQGGFYNQVFNKEKTAEYRAEIDKLGESGMIAGEIFSNYNKTNDKELDELAQKAKSYYDAMASADENLQRSLTRRYTIEEEMRRAREREVGSGGIAPAVSRIAGIPQRISSIGSQALQSNEAIEIEKSANLKKLELVQEFERLRKEYIEKYRNLSAEELKELELEKLKETNIALLENEQLTNEERLLLVEEYEAAKAEIEQKYQNEKIDKIKEGLAITNAMFDTASNFVQTLQDVEMTKIETNYDRKIQLAGEDKTKVSKLEEEKERKIKEIKKKYADIAFAMQIGQIIASTALGIMQGYAQMGPVLGTVFAILTAAVGGLQIASANAERQKVKSLWTGGYTGEGSKHEPKGVVHGDEYVVSSDELAVPEVRSFIGGVVEPMRMRRLGYSSYAMDTTLPKRGFAEGGYTGSSSAGVDMNAINATMERQNRIMAESNALLSKLYSDGVNANFDETKIYEMRKRISKQESGESLAAR